MMRLTCYQVMVGRLDLFGTALERFRHTSWFHVPYLAVEKAIAGAKRSKCSENIDIFDEAGTLCLLAITNHYLMSPWVKGQIVPRSLLDRANAALSERYASPCMICVISNLVLVVLFQHCSRYNRKLKESYPSSVSLAIRVQYAAICRAQTSSIHFAAGDSCSQETKPFRLRSKITKRS